MTEKEIQELIEIERMSNRRMEEYQILKSDYNRLNPVTEIPERDLLKWEMKKILD